MSPTPPDDVLELLQPQWDATSFHEAAHGVAQVARGLPLHDVEIRYKSSPFGRWWTVNGQVRLSRRGSLRVRDDDTASMDGIVVAALAGPEAEARWNHRVTGIGLREARDQAARENSDGDLRRVRTYLRTSSLSRAAADQLAVELVDRWWPVIDRLAAALRAQHRVAGDDVRRLVGCTSPSR
jgi:hypothetical protein